MPTLLELLGIDAEERERRMKFLAFTEKDRDLLASQSAFIESIADRMADVFYERILAFPVTRRFLEDADLVQRLKALQRRHFIQLWTGPYDETYFDSRLRVGLAHARIRLAPHYYLGGYLVQIDFVQRSFVEKFARDPEMAQGCIRSFLKIIMLDISLATDAYIYGGFVDRATADIRAYEATLAQEALENKVREEEKREELLRMIVHDIRSPVTAMMATARAALRRYRDTAESPGKQFALVEATGQSLLSIIDNMVSHARAPGGELPLAPEPFDVAEIVSACVSQLMPFAQQTGHPMTVSMLQPSPTTRLDKILVRRVVSNLLVNACRHTPAGSRIEIACAVDGDWCRIIVADDGPGLPTAVRDALRDPEGIQPKQDAGAYVDSGLGLPFCRLACDRMGGLLELQPSDGRGTRFVVHLPT
jgi:signal transduction histidine kinase